MSGRGLGRRAFLALVAGLASARHAFAQSAWKPQVGVDARIGRTQDGVLKAILGNATMQRGRVRLTLPFQAESGNAVPMTVRVESPMTDADHVRRIDLVSEKNPVPHMGTFFLGPHTGLAEIGTRVRLNGTQRVTAIAQLSDGSFWYDAVEIVVHQPACVDGS
jgi:sulfur-oxidizing protein SoxY